jgi:hypothetical protein
MNLAEFKAWFEGFTEDMDGAPNAKQWRRIKARVKEIDGTAVTERIYFDRYWPTVRPYWHEWYGASYTSYGTNSGLSAQGGSFTSSDAMAALGKADYQSLAAMMPCST